MTFLCATMIATCLARADTTIDATIRDIRFDGDGAWAVFYVVDTTSCALGTVAEVLVETSTFTADVNGAPGTGGNTAFSMTVRDHCVNAVVRTVAGSTSQQELQVDPSLNSASLRCTLPVFDSAAGAFVSMSIDLIWSGMGKIYRDRSGFTDHHDNGMFFSKTYDTSRDAVATGSLILNGVELTLPLSDAAQIETDAHRERSLIRN
jgi:hypothetical protein